jgi:hypothetical protein
MRIREIIVALYPPAVRERWGGELGAEIAERGAQSWADAVTGAVRLWLHPSDWPETATGQTRRVLAVTLFAVAAVATLLLRAAEPPSPPIVTLLWLAPLVAGMLLAAPLPALRPAALRRVCVEGVQTLALPAGAIVALVALGNSGAVEHPAGALRAALLVYYWVTLSFVALRVCAFVARVVRIGILPTARRLHSALLLVGTGTALAAAQSTLDILRTGTPGTGRLATAAALGLLAMLTLRVGRDIRRSIPS